MIERGEELPHGPAFGHSFFEVVMAQGKTEVQPDATADDFSRKTVRLVMRASHVRLRSAAWGAAGAPRDRPREA